MKYAMCCASAFGLGPAYIMSYLKSQGHEVKLIFDPMQFTAGDTKFPWYAKALSVKEHNIRQLIKFDPDVCLFSCLTAHYQWALEMARYVKDELECRIIFGGIHPTVCPDEVRRHSFIDDVCVGDGIEYFGGTFDADEILPDRLPWYDELPAKDRVQPFIMTSFGCPFSCTYCMPKEYRLKLPRRTVSGCIDELRWLKIHGAKRFAIWDDCFTADKVWMANFLTRVKLQIKLPFRCVTHPQLIDHDTVSRLKEAGCYMIALGIQTGNEFLRSAILHRHETNDEFIRACVLIKNSGITLLIDHIFSIPYENNESHRKSYTVYKAAKPNLVNVFDLVYFPKAKIIDYAIDADILKESDREKIDQGLFPQYASGVNNRIANNSPWVNKILAVPLWNWCGYLPKTLIRLIVYGLIYIKTWKDCIPLNILQNHLYFIKRRIQKCLK